MTLVLDFIWFCSVFTLMYIGAGLCMGWWDRQKESDR
jgi:hypothetical protein